MATRLCRSSSNQASAVAWSENPSAVGAAAGRIGSRCICGYSTLAAASWKELPASFKGDKTEQAAEVGKRLAAAAKKSGVETVVFDRGGYLYHGRVKALAESAREGGLSF